MLVLLSLIVWLLVNIYLFLEAKDSQRVRGMCKGYLDDAIGKMKNKEDVVNSVKVSVLKGKFNSPFYKKLFLQDKDLIPFIENLYEESYMIYLNKVQFYSEAAHINSEMNGAISALSQAIAKICNVQFFEEKNLVSKDQVKEIITGMMVELKKNQIENMRNGFENV